MKAKEQRADVHTDAGIAGAIRQALHLDHDVPDEEISVEVRDGVVTLEGNVEEIAQKDIAENDARRVKGVRSVISRIVVRGETV
jgi:osmotically-inducible protein OsmY